MTMKELNSIMKEFDKLKVAYSLTKNDGNMTFYIFGRYDENGNFNSMYDGSVFEKTYIFNVAPNYSFSLQVDLYDKHYLNDDVSQFAIKTYNLNNDQNIWQWGLIEKDEFFESNSTTFKEVEDFIYGLMLPSCFHAVNLYIKYKTA